MSNLIAVHLQFAGDLPDHSIAVSIGTSNEEVAHKVLSVLKTVQVTL